MRKHLTAAHVLEDIAEAEQTIAFIQEKMIFLQKRIQEAGGELVARVTIPLAWKRYCLGPELLAAAEEKLQALKELHNSLKKQNGAT